MTDELSTPTPNQEHASAFPKRATALLERVRQATSLLLVGLEDEVTAALAAQVAGGHVLLEGPPGVAKTLLVRTLAAAVGGDFGRIQFTPDLMPADVTGTSVFKSDDGSFRFRPGPIFAQFLLCDEINRAPAKTQAALLEAMQEHGVTVDGVTHPLPAPFTVFATQNPIEQEGTYPLPEAQLDRFLFMIRVGYPDAANEARLLESAHRRNVTATPGELGVRAVTNPVELIELAHAIEAECQVRHDLFAYLVRLLTATRDTPSLVLGASPRSGVFVLRAAKVFAAFEGRDFVTPDDIKRAFLPALRHRVVLDPAEEIGGLTTDHVLKAIMDRVEVPR
jgi:MoxR-like ATPase